ncbi:MAG: group II truncated hemoglobin [Acidimicrobiia bacterium]|nr:group II truncated hemoglobin [Acidimicrobiia bacterium]
MTVDPESRTTTFPWGEKPTLYEEIGGERIVRQLVERFYDEIDATSPGLRAMHPKDDSGSRRNLFEFLSGWMGGPGLYIERKGHPRLRMRHFPFHIGEREADDWIRCMHTALDSLEIGDAARTFLKERLADSARHVQNRP